MSLETHFASFRPTTTLFGFQQELTAPNAGAWDDIRTVKTGAFEFANDAGEGTVTAFSAEIMISNALTIPANSTDGTVVQTVSSLGAVPLPSLGRWMKVKVTALAVTGGASLGARLQAQNY